MIGSDRKPGVLLVLLAGCCLLRSTLAISDELRDFRRAYDEARPALQSLRASLGVGLDDELQLRPRRRTIDELLASFQRDEVCEAGADADADADGDAELESGDEWYRKLRAKECKGGRCGGGWGGFLALFSKASASPAPAPEEAKKEKAKSKAQALVKAQAQQKANEKEKEKAKVKAAAALVSLTAAAKKKKKIDLKQERNEIAKLNTKYKGLNYKVEQDELNRALSHNHDVVGARYEPLASSDVFRGVQNFNKHIFSTGNDGHSSSSSSNSNSRNSSSGDNMGPIFEFDNNELDVGNLGANNKMNLKLDVDKIIETARSEEAAKSSGASNSDQSNANNIGNNSNSNGNKATATSNNNSNGNDIEKAKLANNNNNNNNKNNINGKSGFTDIDVAISNYNNNKFNNNYNNDNNNYLNKDKNNFLNNNNNNIDNNNNFNNNNNNFNNNNNKNYQQENMNSNNNNIDNKNLLHEVLEVPTAPSAKDKKARTPLDHATTAAIHYPTLSIPSSRSSAGPGSSGNDPGQVAKNDLSHEANYKLSKIEQDASERAKQPNCKSWKTARSTVDEGSIDGAIDELPGFDGLLGKRSLFNPMNEIKLKTSRRLMRKGFGPSLPSYALVDTRREMRLDDLMKRLEKSSVEERKADTFVKLDSLLAKLDNGGGDGDGGGVGEDAELRARIKRLIEERNEQLGEGRRRDGLTRTKRITDGDDGGAARTKRFSEQQQAVDADEKSAAQEKISGEKSAVVEASETKAGPSAAKADLGLAELKAEAESEPKAQAKRRVKRIGDPAEAPNDQGPQERALGRRLSGQLEDDATGKRQKRFVRLEDEVFEDSVNEDRAQRAKRAAPATAAAEEPRSRRRRSVEEAPTTLAPAAATTVTTAALSNSSDPAHKLAKREARPGDAPAADNNGDSVRRLRDGAAATAATAATATAATEPAELVRQKRGGDVAGMRGSSSTSTSSGDFDFAEAARSFGRQQFDNLKQKDPVFAKLEGIKFDNMWYDTPDGDKENNNNNNNNNNNKAMSEGGHKSSSSHSTKVSSRNNKYGKVRHRSDAAPFSGAPFAAPPSGSNRRSMKSNARDVDRDGDDIDFDLNSGNDFNNNSDNSNDDNNNDDSSEPNPYLGQKGGEGAGEDPSRLMLSLRDEILNCSAFTQLENMLKSYQRGSNNLSKESSDQIDMDVMPSPCPRPSPNFGGETSPDNAESVGAPANASAHGNATSNGSPSKSVSVSMSFSDKPPTTSTTAKTTTGSSTTSATTTTPPPPPPSPTSAKAPTTGAGAGATEEAAKKEEDLMKLNITINASVTGDHRSSNFFGNGTINVRPGFAEDRERRGIAFPEFEQLEKRGCHAKNAAKDADDRKEGGCEAEGAGAEAGAGNNSFPLDGLTTGKLTAQVVKSVFGLVRSNPKLKVLWPSLKNNQPSSKQQVKNFYAIRNHENESEMHRTEQMLQKAMETINDIIDQQVRSRTCVPLRPDLAAFYEQVLKTYEEQDRSREKREAAARSLAGDFSKEVRAIDANSVAEKSRVVKKLLRQYEDLPQEDQLQVAGLRDGLLMDLVFLRKLRNSQELLQERRKRAVIEEQLRAQPSDRQVQRKLEEDFTPAFLKLLKTAELFREVVGESEDA